MGRKLVRIPLPLLWTRSSTKSFYQVIKGSNVSAKAFDDSGNNIPGRSIIFREYYGRDTRSTGLCNNSATAPRIYDKFQEVCFRTNSGNRVSGYDCERKDNGIVFTSGKGSENKESVSGGVQNTKDNLVRTNTFVRNINFHYSSSSPSTSSVSVSSTRTNSNTKEECILHGHSDIERYGQRGTCVVDKKFRIKQCSGHYSVSLTDTNKDRYFQERLGCCVSRHKNWGPMVKERTGVSYKSFRTFSNKICTSNLQQNDEFQISTYPSRQPNCLELPLKDGREKEPGTSQSFEGDLRLSSQTSDHDYCGVPPRLSKSSGRMGVEKSKGFHKVEIMSTSIPENLSEDGSTRDRSICFSVVQSAPSLLLMEARPKQFGPKCTAANLVAQALYAFPPSSLIHRVLRKVGLEKVHSLRLIAPT